MSSPVKYLGVVPHGGPLTGSHFNKLFRGNSVQVTKPSDLTPQIGAIIFWGGEDISPSIYNKEPNFYSEATSLPSRRDLLELTLMGEARLKEIPMIGVCRGAQLLCAFAGGELYQHVPGHKASSHTITCRGVDYYSVPADHHQMMCPPEDAHVLGWATIKQSSGYYDEKNVYKSFPVGFKEPEIVWFPSIKALGIQPHPEWAHENHSFVQLCLDLCKEKLCL